MLGHRTESLCDDMMKAMRRHVHEVEQAATDLNESFRKEVDNRAAEIKGLWDDLATLRDERIPAHAEQLDVLTKRIAAIEAWQAKHRGELVKVVEKICSEHLLEIDQKCQKWSIELLSHLLKAEGASKDAALEAAASAESAEAAAQSSATARSATDQATRHSQMATEAEQRSRTIADGVTRDAEAIHAKWEAERQRTLQQCDDVVARMTDAKVETLEDARKAEGMVTEANRLLDEMRTEWKQHEQHLRNLNSVWKRLRWVFTG